MWVLVWVAAGLAVGPPASADSPYFCDGHPATIVAQGVVKINGTAGDDVIYVLDDGYHEVRAGAGSDLVCGYPDTVYGGAGDDTVESTFVQDANRLTAYGEEGNDTLIAYPQGGVPGWDPANILLGGAGDDTLTGGDQDDQISGDAGNDTITGGAGDDSLADDGEAVNVGDPATHADGADHIDGGPGNDYVMVNAGTKTAGGADVVDGGSGHDIVSYDGSHAGAVVDLATHVAVGTGGAVDTFQSFEGPFYGSRYADTILGTSGPDDVIDYNGDNVVKTYGGDDQLLVESGTVYTGSRNDTFGPISVHGVTVHLGAGNDQAIGDIGDGTLMGGPGDDRFRQHQPTDGDTSRVTYRGGSGHDILTMNYQLLSDFYRPLTIRSAHHLISWTTPGEDNDFYPNAVHYVGIDVLKGGNGPDRFYGSAGSQWFEGGGGNDRMWGATGNDVLLGGPGRDHASGGRGRDRCTAEHRSSCELR